MTVPLCSKFVSLESMLTLQEPLGRIVQKLAGTVLLITAIRIQGPATEDFVCPGSKMQTVIGLVSPDSSAMLVEQNVIVGMGLATPYRDFVFKASGKLGILVEIVMSFAP